MSEQLHFTDRVADFVAGWVAGEIFKRPLESNPFLPILTLTVLRIAVIALVRGDIFQLSNVYTKMDDLIQSLTNQCQPESSCSVGKPTKMVPN